MSRCNCLILRPTEELPLTKALARGTQVLGRQQLQQSMKHLIVPPGSNLWNLPVSRVVSAPPGVTISAGCRSPLMTYVAAVSPFAFAVFSNIILRVLVRTWCVTLLTVVGRLLVGLQLSTILNGVIACRRLAIGWVTR